MAKAKKTTTAPKTAPEAKMAPAKKKAPVAKVAKPAANRRQGGGCQDRSGRDR